MKKTQSNSLNSKLRESRYISPTPGELPIVACSLQWDNAYSIHAPNKNFLSIFQTAVLWAKECHFNIGIVSSSIPGMQRYFEEMGSYVPSGPTNDITYSKLKYFVGCSTLFPANTEFNDSNIKDFIVDTRIQPYLCEENNKDGIIRGWYIFDEPKTQTLKYCKKYIDELLKITPLVLPFINFIGGTHVGTNFYTPDSSIGSKESNSDTVTIPTFQNYINYVRQNADPVVWSYDLYPILTNSLSIYTEYQPFYYDMEVMRHISYLSNEPFWAFCQSAAFATIDNSVIRPSATTGTFRFEAFSALAYGAKGILYWTYTLRIPNIKDGKVVEYYTSALVGPKLKNPNIKGEYELFKFPAYYAAQQVNSEIRKYEKIFLNTEAFQVRHSGTASNILDIFNKVVPKPKKKGKAFVQAESTEDLVVCRRLEGAIGPFTKIESCPIGILVSVLVPVTSELKQNSRYVVIVNHDPFNNQIVTMFRRNETVITELTECDKPLNDGTGYSHNPAATSMPRNYNGTVPAGQKADCRVLLPGSYMIFEYESTDLTHDFD